MEQPDLGGIDPVPMRAVAVWKQEQDGGCAVAAARRVGLAMGFTVMAAFRMRLEAQAVDDLRLFVRQM